MFDDENNGQLRDLYILLQHFVYFSIDDHSGTQLTHEESYEAHCTRLSRLQKTALKRFKEKLTVLSLSNYAAIDKRTELEGHLATLTDAELEDLCSQLELRTDYPKLSKVVTDRRLFIEILLCTHERRKTFQESVRNMTILPTEVGYQAKQPSNILLIFDIEYFIRAKSVTQRAVQWVQTTSYSKTKPTILKCWGFLMALVHPASLRVLFRD